jgi:perosamine synthetase
MVTVIFDPKFGLLKEEIIRMMKEKGIDLRLFFYPLSSQPAYSAFASAREARGRNMGSYRISPYGVNLPCWMNMTYEYVNYVCDAVKEVVGVE